MCACACCHSSHSKYKCGGSKDCTLARAAASPLRQGHALGPAQRVLRPLAARRSAVALHERRVLLAFALVGPLYTVSILVPLASWPQQLSAWHRCRRSRRAWRRLARQGLGPIVALPRPVHGRRDSLLCCPALAVWVRFANTTQGAQSHGAYGEDRDDPHPPWCCQRGATCARRAPCWRALRGRHSGRNHWISTYAHQQNLMP